LQLSHLSIDPLFATAAFGMESAHSASAASALKTMQSRFWLSVGLRGDLPSIFASQWCGVNICKNLFPGAVNYSQSAIYSHQNKNGYGFYWQIYMCV